MKLDRAADGAGGGPLDGFVLSPTDAAPGGANDDTKDSDAALVIGTPTITGATTGPGVSHTPTYDFGFSKAPRYSIGNRVWADEDNTGGMNGSEAGIDGVKVNLLQKQVDGSYLQIATDTTAGGGYYRFDGLPVGDFKVVVDPSNWAVGGALEGRRSSTGSLAQDDPNAPNDMDDNGLNPASIAQYPIDGVTSGVITLGLGKSEPAGETDLSASGQGAEDRRGDMRIDFGFFTPKFAVGNYVWMDSDRDGIQDGTEGGVNGVTVKLYNLAGSEIATTTTANGPDGKPGYYLFDDLVAGTYSVGFTPMDGYVLTTLDATSATEATDSDANRTTGRTVTFVLDESLPVVTAADGTGLRAGNVLRDVDAGIYPVFSLGNTVWHDLDGNSKLDSGEPGIDGVTVSLFAADASGLPTGAAVATDVTSGGGSYLFTGLIEGSYVVVIGSDQLAPSGPLGKFHSSGTNGTGELVAAQAENGTDNDDNGTVATSGDFAGAVISSKVVLGPNPNEPTGEPATPGRTDLTPDAQSNLTVDFGFVTMSLGSLVWVDTDNNGVKNGSETGIAGVPVRIYRDDNADGLPDGNEVASTSTNAAGEYLFTGLTPGKYVVEIVAPVAHYSSTGNPTGYVGPFEPGKADDLGADSTDHGTTVANVIRSTTITLSPATEPLAAVEADAIGSGFANPATDANTDLTIDFGIVPAASLGNYVWLDNNRNGLQDDAADAGINGVTVKLLGPDGAIVRTTITSTGPDGKPGYYRFDVLPGDYRVEFDLTTLPEGFVVSPKDKGANDGADSDGDPTTGRTAITTIVAGENDPTWDLGIYPTAVVVGNQVWLDGNANGLNDDGPTSGVPGVTATLYDAKGKVVTKDIQGNPVVPQITDAGGFYLFESLAPGTYTVKFTLPAGYSTTRSDMGGNDTIDSDGLAATSKALKGGQSDLTLDLGLVQPVTVGDRTFIDVNQNGIQDSPDRPLEGVVLRVVDARTGAPVKTDVYGKAVVDQVSDASGLYLFKDLPPGIYRVHVISVPAGYQPTATGKGSRSNDSATAEDTTVELFGADEDRTLDFGFYIPNSDVVAMPITTPTTTTVPAPTTVPPANPAPAAAVTTVPPAPADVPVAAPALGLGDAQSSQQGVLGGSESPDQLAYTGSPAAAAARIALLLLGLGLCLSAFGYRRSEG